MTYETLSSLAREHGYTDFTVLQEQAFRHPEFTDPERDLMIVGATSTGKTLVPLLLYAASVREARAAGEPIPKMLFVVPYRALAAQKLREICEFFDGEGLRIIQSTGEFRQGDGAVLAGEVDVAVVINEKVFLYASRDSSFLRQYDLLVLDEIGLLQNAERGVKLDFILAWARAGRLAALEEGLPPRPRLVALGTPFYDWGAYIENYGLLEIRCNERPIRLHESQIFYHRTQVSTLRVEGDPIPALPSGRILTRAFFDKMTAKYGAEFGLHCPRLDADALCPIADAPLSDPSLPCPKTGAPCTAPVTVLGEGEAFGQQYLLLKLCREHLALGHQILVFINDREMAKNLAQCIYEGVRDLLPEPPDRDTCKERILRDCDLEAEDVYGILENDADGEHDTPTDLYRAFAAGVAFHSAEIPNELRTYVEDHFLDDPRDLRIVCSTETLAFGVNSTVDVVIVASMTKREHAKERFLTVNEHRNYAGRAGRLRRSGGRSEGFVYTLLTEKQVPAWERFLESAKTPERLYSLFYGDPAERMPFFLLNLFPTGNRPVRTRELLDAVSTLPQNADGTPDALAENLRLSVERLLRLGLVTRVRRLARGEDRGGNAYALTETGNRLRGYVLCASDFETLREAVEGCASSLLSDGIDSATFLYRLLSTKHLENGLSSAFEDSASLADFYDVVDFIEDHLLEGNHTLPGWYDDLARDDFREISEAEEERLYVLAALLSWMEGASAKTLYTQFGIHYALLSKIAEQVGYLIEIAIRILPMRMEELYLTRNARLGISEETFIERSAEKEEEMRRFFVRVFYGINTEIAEELAAYLTEVGEESTLELYSIRAVDPTVARRLRRLGVRYRFFDSPPEYDESDVEARNNYANQRDQYLRDVHAMGPAVEGFFRARFGDAFPAP